MLSNVDAVIGAFLDKVEMDEDFFAYYGVDEEEALTLAKERSMGYLRQAIVMLKRRVELPFALALKDEKSFEEPITDDEVDLLSEIMLLKYFERGLAKLKPQINMFSASELRLLHSPANERTSYVEMISSCRENVREMISWYESKDRITGANKLVDHNVPDDVETE